jgi:Pyruvate/2-oxoacid:ferredoxin oxidoreductase delta subunit
MEFNRTGLWRYLMPVLKDRTAPCQKACPIGMPSPDFINDLANNDPAGALARIMEVNPLPGITGRLCYHPCQAKCLRKGLDQAIGIQKLEKYLADTAPEPDGKPLKASKGRVLVLGAGPLGLSAAYFLGRGGLQVIVADPLDRTGGFLTEVDQNRLPGEVLGRETGRLAKAAGLELKLKAKAEFGKNADWDLVILDKTAHTAGSEAAASLAGMAEAVSGSHQVLDTDGLAPTDSFKSSQIAVAVAAGRGLSAYALGTLGLQEEQETLQKLSASDREEAGLGQEDIRYDLFDAVAQDEVSHGDTSPGEQALTEARRCLSCGHCNLCGRCLVFCPDVSLSVNEQMQRLQVDMKHCKGCGICARECPRGAIVMERE